MQVLENEIMSRHTSFKVGGPARFFAKVENMVDLKEALTFAQGQNLPYFVLGNGTNLLVSDKGFQGVVICLSGEFSEIVDLGDGIFKVGAATPLGRFARTTLKQGFAGIHKLAGIPGTLGGAVFMNAGAYGQEIGNCCTAVTTLDSDGNIHERTAHECGFGYRRSIFKDCNEIILSATFQLQSATFLGKSTAELEAELEECMAKRKATQPLNKPNAGSTFKRLEHGATEMPTQVAPGYYIEQAGLKGYRIGGAEVSTLHANFIVNVGNATAQDIRDLSEYVQSKVAEKFGVFLQREIILLGEF
jgi:UDP-N-acetylmuramate dehydrogenase